MRGPRGRGTEVLRRTFIHIPGIGAKTERALWKRGVRTWEDLLLWGGRFLPPPARDLAQSKVEESARRLALEDVGFFGRSLPHRELWRIFREFRHRVAYLDIETTARPGGGCEITTVALYDGQSLRTYIRGENLWEFPQDVMGYKILVTYNGRCFDLPILRESLRARLDHVHIDLRFLLSALGFRGGLKGCERAMGIERGDLENVDGYFAVLFWEDYLRTEDPRALETLLAYNSADAVNLERLMVKAYNMKVLETPFGEELLMDVPPPHPIPFKPDKGIIERARERISASKRASN
jgi:uncharacterized protein YprB with RNaseH-like and TPR domain